MTASIDAVTRRAMSHRLGSEVLRWEARGGGDINQAFRVTLADGRSVFAKLNDRAPPGLFACEAEGLAWLGEAAALPVPRVLGVGEAGSSEGGLPFLLLEWLEPAPRASGFDERLGEGLAALHRAGAPGFGFERDNFIGLLPQDNRPAQTWVEFYGQRRLAPLFERARRAGLTDATLDRDADALLARLDERLGPPEPPARLHGDLWGGNLHVGARGEPVLIDPAVYAGHREVDLAMMRLFGGFGERVFAAYAASHPLAPGFQERVALYQLYPLLVHLCLFGRGYLAQVERCVARYA